MPFLLFAYLEVPQASTGLSPFELLYNWHIQGPLDLLQKELETSGGLTEEGSGIALEMLDQLESYRDQARENMQQVQQEQKRLYNQRAGLRQKVLLLLPTFANKLLTKWHGPYTITRKMGNSDL